jgi:hypothetical protein
MGFVISFPLSLSIAGLVGVNATARGLRADFTGSDAIAESLVDGGNDELGGPKKVVEFCTERLD